METLKVFPQIFFDAIARVVPGLVAMLLYAHFCGWSSWHQFVEEATGIKGDQGFPSGFVFSFVIVGGYIVGHLISPFTKMIQRLGEVLPEEWWKHKQVGENDHSQKAPIFDPHPLSQRIVALIKRIEALRRKRIEALRIKRVEAKDFKKEASKNYESLRLQCPEVGGLCAKIRAEFEMYNGLCVVFLIYALAIAVKYIPDTTQRIPDTAVLALLALLMGGRGRATNVTFQKAVNKFASSARESGLLKSGPSERGIISARSTSSAI